MAIMVIMVIWLLLFPINNGYLYDNNLLIIMIDGNNRYMVIWLLLMEPLIVTN